MDITELSPRELEDQETVDRDQLRPASYWRKQEPLPTPQTYILTEKDKAVKGIGNYLMSRFTPDSRAVKSRAGHRVKSRIQSRGGRKTSIANTIGKPFVENSPDTSPRDDFSDHVSKQVTSALAKYRRVSDFG